jgi:uncharacterized protein YyaL (SSP411 family)
MRFWILASLIFQLGGHHLMAQNDLTQNKEPQGEAVALQNQLADAISPYLKQHADNPVHWQQWNEEAFALAKKLNRPIFLSIGYSTCHWCHVMNRESFQNPAIAKLLNTHYISIKVDREERPDIDRVYMTFVTATTGSGGWPLSVWLTPDLQPFAGGTYYPPEDRWGRPGFASILQQIAQAWDNDQSGIIAAGQKVIEQLRSASSSKYRAELDIDDGLLHKTYQNQKSSYDPQFGGFSAAPKFPRPSAPAFMLRYHKYAKKPDALNMTLHTLRAMAEGGIYDQVGGGFHRYSVDKRWHVPHFEKMLYDQALLVPLYLDAYVLSGDPFYARIARETLTYVTRDLTGPQGQFYSAEDADSSLAEDPEKHAEGAFYVWTAEEIDDIARKDSTWIKEHLGAEKTGNVKDDPHQEFVGKNILYIASPLVKIAKHANVESDIQEAYQEIRGKLLASRSKRPRPHRDDKAITAWNGLMISAYMRAHQVLGEESYRDTAVTALEFIRENLYDMDTRELRRLYRDGKASGSGFLVDFAFMIQALLDAYETVFDTQYLQWAIELQQIQNTLFGDKTTGGYYETAADNPHVLIRMKEDHDGAIPAGNSVAAMNLLRLSEFTSNEKYREQAIKTIQAFSRSLIHIPHSMPTMVSAVDWLLNQPSQVLIDGIPNTPEANELLKVLHSHYMPNRIIMMTHSPDGNDPASIQPHLSTLKNTDTKNTTVYLCQDFVCELPVTTPEDLQRLLK